MDLQSHINRPSEQVYWNESPPTKGLGDSALLPPASPHSPSLGYDAEIDKIVHHIGLSKQNSIDRNQSDQNRLFSEENLKSFNSKALERPSSTIPPHSPARRDRIRRALSHDVAQMPGSESSKSRQAIIAELAGSYRPISANQPSSITALSGTKTFGATTDGTYRSEAGALPPRLSHPPTSNRPMHHRPISRATNEFRRSASTPQAPSAPSQPSLVRTESSFDLTDLEELDAIMRIHESQTNVKSGDVPPTITTTPDQPAPPTVEKVMPDPFVSTPSLTNPDIEKQDRAALLTPSRDKSLAYERFLVLQVTVSYYFASPNGASGSIANNTYQYPEKILRLFAERGGYERHIHLREDWCSTDVKVGFYVHVIGTFDPQTSQAIIDNAHGTLIVHPDCLISCTQVAGAFMCLRRSVLQDRVREPADPNSAMVYGSLIHQLFQAAIRVNDFSATYLEGLIDRVVRHALSDLYLVGESEVQARAHLVEWSVVLQQWAATYISPVPRSDA
ncbi:DNA replication factor Dna2-domain-containing protein, partial [Dimargaris cristalligena]